MDQKNTLECDIYGCRNFKVSDSEVAIMIGETPVYISVCQFHLDYVNTTDPGLYEVGYTYRREVELRPIPAVAVEG